MDKRYVELLSQIREHLESSPEIAEAVRMTPDRHPEGTNAGADTVAHYVKHLRKRAQRGDWRALHAMSQVAHHAGAPKKAADYAARAKTAKAKEFSPEKKSDDSGISKEHQKARERLSAYHAKHGHYPPFGHVWGKDESSDQPDELDSYMAEVSRLLVRETGIEEDVALDLCFELASLAETNGHLPEMPSADAPQAEISSWIEAAEATMFALQAIDEVVRISSFPAYRSREAAAKDIRAARRDSASSGDKDTRMAANKVMGSVTRTGATPKLHQKYFDRWKKDYHGSDGNGER